MIPRKLQDLDEKQRNHLTSFCAAMDVGVAEAFEAFTSIVGKLTSEIFDFNTAVRHVTYDNALLAWRRYNDKKMPGSNRTARLRRKRRKAVLQWYLDVYLRTPFLSEVPPTREELERAAVAAVAGDWTEEHPCSNNYTDVKGDP